MMMAFGDVCMIARLKLSVGGSISSIVCFCPVYWSGLHEISPALFSSCLYITSILCPLLHCTHYVVIIYTCGNGLSN